jgi:hypothetical protein
MMHVECFLKSRLLLHAHVMLRSDDEAAASDPKRPFSPDSTTGISCAQVLLIWPVPIFVVATVTGALIRGHILQLPSFIIIIIIINY